LDVWLLDAISWQHPATTRPTTFYVCKTKGC